MLPVRMVRMDDQAHPDLKESRGSQVCPAEACLDPRVEMDLQVKTIP